MDKNKVVVMVIIMGISTIVIYPIITVGAPYNHDLDEAPPPFDGFGKAIKNFKLYLCTGGCRGRCRRYANGDQLYGPYVYACLQSPCHEDLMTFS